MVVISIVKAPWYSRLLWMFRQRKFSDFHKAFEYLKSKGFRLDPSPVDLWKKNRKGGKEIVVQVLES